MLKMKKLHIDIETYSSADIKKCGAYKYAESPDFEILLVAFSYDGSPVVCMHWLDVPPEFFDWLQDPTVIKIAHNAAFERICFRAAGYDVPPEQWRCSAVKASYCGLPMALGEISKVLELGEQGKLSTGTHLINYFCKPCKPTIANGGRTRNLSKHNPDKWLEFMKYCVNDVVAEMAILDRLKGIKVPASEWELYAIDQRINDAGVLIDEQYVHNTLQINAINATRMHERLKEITGLDNPNSGPQLKAWLNGKATEEITTLAKGAISKLEAEAVDPVLKEVYRLRLESSKTSIKKYNAMQNVRGADGRARGLFQFYGAGRTGRWAGRLIQLQNLPRNYLKDLDLARQLVAENDFETLALLFDVSDTLSQLIRTALIASPGRTFAVSDFSAIEARVLAWLADQTWRLDVFKTHGKIYEASASQMFKVPIDSISYEDENGQTQKGPNYEMRARGKVAELALGYQGAVGALKQMGGESMGLSDIEMQHIVNVWRDSNRMIVYFWKEMQEICTASVKGRKRLTHTRTGLVFDTNETGLRIILPSGRELCYWKAHLGTNRFGQETVKYYGVDAETKKWTLLDTYGGKITENIVQAVARDLLKFAMIRAHENGYKIAMHIHDEIVVECAELDAADDLRVLEHIMSQAPEWAAGLPLGADGFLTKYYKKD